MLYSFLLYSKGIQLCIYIYVYMHIYYFPLWLITGYGIQFPALGSRTLLQNTNLNLLIPNSKSILTTPLHKGFLFYFLYKFYSLRFCAYVHDSIEVTLINIVR